MSRTFLFLTVMIVSFTMFVSAVQAGEVAVSEAPYLLQLQGTLQRSEEGDSLEDALWLTEAISSEQARVFMALQDHSWARSAYHLRAFDAGHQELSVASFVPIGTSHDLRIDLVLPRGTAVVELQAPDGSVVQQGKQVWQENAEAPILSDLRLRMLNGTSRQARLSWEIEGASDGSAVWYSADAMNWHLLARTNATDIDVALGELSGGILDGDYGEFAITAAHGFAAASISARLAVPWLLPVVRVQDVAAGATLTYERQETIELRAAAWDAQERWLIAERVLWLDDLGNILVDGAELLLPASRFPVDSYGFTAMTMNQHNLFGGQEIRLEIKAAISESSLGGVWIVEGASEASPLFPLRRVLEEAGWGIVYQAGRREININGYHDSFTVQVNGDVWKEGFFQGQINLRLLAGQNWISIEDLGLLGFAALWDEEARLLHLSPK